MALRGKLERQRLSTPPVTKSSQANLSLVEASVAHLGAMMKRERVGGEDGEGRLNVTLALICHIVSHRYEENASRLNVRGET